MSEELKQAIISGNSAISVVVNASELRSIIQEMMSQIDDYANQQAAKRLDDPILTKDDVCKMLNISKRTLWRIEKRGALLPHKIESRSMYTMRDVKNYINENKRSN